MRTKFPDDAPLTFFADNNMDSKKWTIEDFNEHQLDYDKAREDANNRMGVPKGGVGKRAGETYLSNWLRTHKMKAALEADLALVESGVGMSWIPTNYEIEDNPKHLDGH